MKTVCRKLVACLALLVMALAVGCASNPAKVALRDDQGCLVKDAQGNAQFEEYDLTDESFNHFTQWQAAKHIKPLWSMDAATTTTTTYEYDGEGKVIGKKVEVKYNPIELKGVKSVATYGRNGLPVIKQYKNPWVPVALKGIDAAMVGGVAKIVADGVAGAKSGDTNNYNGDISAQGSNLNLGRGSQTGGATTASATAEGATATGGSPSTTHAPVDNSQRSESLGLDLGK